MPIPITARGAEKLKEELQRLKSADRPAVIQAIKEAREKGDLSENAEYDAARERQGFIEGRIQELEGKVGALQIIDPAAVDAGGRIVFGATVALEDLVAGVQVKYQIVGDDEADIKAGLISISSPIARALIGGLRHDIPAHDEALRALVPQRLLGFREAAQAALDAERMHTVAARWTEGALMFRGQRPDHASTPSALRAASCCSTTCAARARKCR